MPPTSIVSGRDPPEDAGRFCGEGDRLALPLAMRSGVRGRSDGGTSPTEFRREAVIAPAVRGRSTAGSDCRCSLLL